MLELPLLRKPFEKGFVRVGTTHMRGYTRVGNTKGVQTFYEFHIRPAVQLDTVAVVGRDNGPKDGQENFRHARSAARAKVPGTKRHRHDFGNGNTLADIGSVPVFKQGVVLGSR